MYTRLQQILSQDSSRTSAHFVSCTGIWRRKGTEARITRIVWLYLTLFQYPWNYCSTHRKLVDESWWWGQYTALRDSTSHYGTRCIKPKRIEYILEWNLANPSVWILSVPFSLKGSSKCTNHGNVHKLYAVEYIYPVCSLDYPFQFGMF